VRLPDTLHIFLTQECNLSCSYCFVNKKCTGKETADTQKLKKSIQWFLKLKTGNYKRISLGGGEPLLKFNKVRDLSGFIKKKSAESEQDTLVLVVSNATLLNKNKLNFFIQNNISLKISLDGEKKSHDLSRQFQNQSLGSTYDTILKNIKSSPSTFKLGISLVFTPKTVGYLYKNIEFLHKMGFSPIDFYPDFFTNWSAGDIRLMDKIFKKVKNYFLKFLKDGFRGKAENILQVSFLNNLLNGRDLDKPVSCNKVNLDPEGNFYCCDKIFALPKNSRSSYLVGDSDNGLDNSRRLRLLNAIRKRISNITDNACKGCEYAKYCFCQVGHYIYFTENDLDFKDYFPKFCRISKIYIKNFLEIKQSIYNSVINK